MTLTPHIKSQARDDILLTGQNVISETVPLTAARAAFVMATGTVYFAGIPLVPGDVIANLTANFSVAGTLQTLAKLGLYSPAGVRLALSADQSGVWTTTGKKTAAMIAPYTVLTAGMYYAAIIDVFTGVAPNFSAGQLTGITLANSTLAGGQLLFGIQTGQADLPANAVIAAGAAASGAQPWIAAT